MIPANQTTTATLNIGAVKEIENEAAQGAATKINAKLAGKGALAKIAPATPIKGTAVKTATKVGELEAPKVAAKIKTMATKGAVVNTTTTGKTALLGKNAALITKPTATKGALVTASKSTAAKGVGVGLSLTTWGPVMLAGILIATGTGVYFYLKKRGIMGELEEVST